MEATSAHVELVDPVLELADLIAEEAEFLAPPPGAGVDEQVLVAVELERVKVEAAEIWSSAALLNSRSAPSPPP